MSNIKDQAKAALAAIVYRILIEIMEEMLNMDIDGDGKPA